MPNKARLEGAAVRPIPGLARRPKPNDPRFRSVLGNVLTGRTAVPHPLFGHFCHLTAGSWPIQGGLGRRQVRIEARVHRPPLILR